jgi:hypothetical protein
MSLNRRLSDLENDHPAGRYIAVVHGDTVPDEVEAFLPGGADRQTMPADDPRLKQIIQVIRTEDAP